jgi:hypothetical protein
VAGSACVTEPSAVPALVGETSAFAGVADFPDDAWAFTVWVAGSFLAAGCGELPWPEPP